MAATKTPPDPKKTLVMVAVTAIDRSPFQPRRSFPEKELQELAETIKRHGILQKPIVRKRGQRYQLIAGERRLRAAKIAGLTRIPVELVAADDAAAAEMAAIENLQRKDLSAVEEALAFKSLLDRDKKLTETELARRLGVSQPHVANRLRLLGLPDFVQQKIISREIPPSHARQLVPLKDHPKILKAIVKQVDADVKQDGSVPSLGEFQHVIDWKLRDKAKPLNSTYWHGPSGTWLPAFTPTDEQREKLGIVRVGYDGDEDEYATNVKLWDKLQAEHAKALAAKGAKKKPKGGNNKPKGKNGKPAKLTAAEKKRLAAEEKRKAQERAATFKKRLYQWRVNWQRWLIAEWIRKQAGEAALLRLAILVDVQWMRGYQWDRGDRLATIVRAAGEKVGGSQYDRQFVRALFALDEPDAVKVAAKFLATAFWHDAPNEQIVPAGDVERLAGELAIDLETEWLNDQAGPMSEAYWNLHNKEQLAALAKELKAKDIAEDAAKAKKGELVKRFLDKRPGPEDIEVGLDMPKEIKKVKRPANFVG